MPDRAISPDDLVRLLEQRHLPPGGAKHAEGVTHEQVDVLVARIASLTEALRGTRESQTAQLASRILLEDLALVVAQLRGRANELVESLTRAQDGIRESVVGDAAGSHEQTDSPGAA